MQLFTCSACFFILSNCQFWISTIAEPYWSTIGMLIATHAWLYPQKRPLSDSRSSIAIKFPHLDSRPTFFDYPFLPSNHELFSCLTSNFSLSSPFLQSSNFSCDLKPEPKTHSFVKTNPWVSLSTLPQTRFHDCNASALLTSFPWASF